MDAGFDRFDPALVEQYFGEYARKELGIEPGELLALGRKNTADRTESFNMALLAIRGSGAVNGVSRLHGKVSRRLFKDLFVRWPEDEVPIGHVTNGVHVPSWDSAASDALWTEACGKDRWLGTTETLDENILRIPDLKLWQFRLAASKAFVEYARKRLSRELAVSGAPPDEVEGARRLFDPDALTLGFARRFAEYKRPNLLLHDPKRLMRIFSDPLRPVQLIIAGKAHPKDHAGQAMIREWTHFIRSSGARSHVIFLSDYDMLLTEQMVQGVDLWINTPRRPWEASGTSGMKVLVNGGLNLSELDGWWAEAYRPEVGWALGDGLEHDSDPAWDAAEAEALYELLEREVIPEFYTRDGNGIPVAWVARMRESMARLTPVFSANRSVREYIGQRYIPAALAYRERRKDKGAAGEKIVAWQRALSERWLALRFGSVKVETTGGRHTFEVQVYLDEIDPDAVCVELYANADSGKDRVSKAMERVGKLPGTAFGYIYRTSVSATRPSDDYTPRLVPFYPGVKVPLEASQILWQR